MNMGIRPLGQKSLACGSKSLRPPSCAAMSVTGTHPIQVRPHDKAVRQGRIKAVTDA